MLAENLKDSITQIPELTAPPRGWAVSSPWARNLLTFLMVFGPGLIVMEADVGAIAEGTKIKFQVRAWPGRDFAGTISRVSHWVDTKTRTMAVEADVDQSQSALDPGMFVEVVGPLRRNSPSLFVPASAVLETAEAIFVERVRQGKVERVPVHRGSTMGDLIEVFGSLNAGDSVVVGASEDLVNGTRVIPRHSQS